MVQNLIPNPNMRGQGNIIDEFTNLVTNPAMKTASGTTTLATNLLTNPNLSRVPGPTTFTNLVTNPQAEATSGTVVVNTNYVYNPTAAVDTTNASAYAESGAVVTRVTGLTGLPAGVTTGYRVNCVVGTGIQLYTWSHPTGTPCTGSLYVRLISGTATGWKPAFAGQLAAPTPITLTTAWQRLTLTHSPTVSNVPFGIRNDVNNTGAVIEVAAVQVEGRSVATEYFSGATAAAGDFTYAWTGTAHNSASEKRAYGVTGYSVHTASTPNKYAVISSGSAGSRVARYIAPAGIASPSWRYAFATSFDPLTIANGLTYTLIVRMRVGGGWTTQNIAPRLQKGDFSGAVNPAPTAVSVGTEWVEFRQTFNAIAAGTSGVGLYIGLPTPGTTDSWLDIDYWAIVPGHYRDEFFTGDTTDNEVATYSWTGTANASTSTKVTDRPVTVARNLLTNPGAELAEGWKSNNSGVWTATFDSTVFRTGTKSCRCELNAGQASVEALSLYAVGQHGSGQLPINGGRPHSAAVWVRAGQAGYQARCTLYFYDSAGALLPQVHGAWTDAPAGTWVRPVVENTLAPANAVKCYFMLWVTKITGSATPGDFAHADSAILVEGAKVPDSFDGATADDASFSYSWTGAANTSSSIKTAQVPAEFTPLDVDLDGSLTVYKSNERIRTAPHSIKLDSIATTSEDDFVKWQQYGLVSGTEYRLTAWSYVDSTPSAQPSSNRSMWVHDGVGSVVSVWPTTFVGQWIKHELVFTASAIGHEARLYAQPGTRTYWTDIMVAKSSEIAEFFSGDIADTADYTFSWTGTANNSTSTKTAVGVVGWSNRSSQPAIHQVASDWSEKALKFIVPKAAYEVGAHGSAVAAVQNQWVTLLFRYSGTAAGRISCGIERFSAAGGYLGGNYSLLTNPAVVISEGDGWYRFSVQLPADANIAVAKPMFYTSALGLAGDEHLIHNVHLSIGAGAYNGPYFDGDTTDTTIYDYQWAGVPHASISKKTAATVAGWNTGRVVQVRDGGQDALRATVNSLTSVGGGAQRIEISPRLGITAGETYFASAELWSESAAAITDWFARIGWLDGSGNVVGSSVTATVIATDATAPTRVTVTGTAPEGATQADVWFGPWTAAQIQSGDVFFVDKAIAGEGEFWQYFDGDMRQAEWDGTAHNSASTLSLPLLTYFDGTNEIFLDPEVGETKQLSFYDGVTELPVTL